MRRRDDVPELSGGLCQTFHFPSEQCFPPGLKLNTRFREALHNIDVPCFPVLRRVETEKELGLSPSSFFYMSRSQAHGLFFHLPRPSSVFESCGSLALHALPLPVQ